MVLGVGKTVHILDLINQVKTEPYIVVVPKDIDFDLVAKLINAYFWKTVTISKELFSKQMMASWSIIV